MPIFLQVTVVLEKIEENFVEGRTYIHLFPDNHNTELSFRTALAGDNMGITVYEKSPTGPVMINPDFDSLPESEKMRICTIVNVISLSIEFFKETREKTHIFSTKNFDPDTAELVRLAFSPRGPLC